jgi:hypothetical protein
MLNSIRDRRIQRDGLYELTLQMPESEYFNAYDTLTTEAAYEILGNFLSYHQDDGRPEVVDIEHNKNGHIVNIKANLHYLGNDHTDVGKTSDMMNKVRGRRE